MFVLIKGEKLLDRFLWKSQRLAIGFEVDVKFIAVYLLVLLEGYLCLVSFGGLDVLEVEHRGLYVFYDVFDLLVMGLFCSFD